jgi:hypothetical protein
MTFVAPTMDPWEVPATQAVEVMQKIWNVTSSFEYEIMTSMAVYLKVCTWFNSGQY